MTTKQDLNLQKLYILSTGSAANATEMAAFNGMVSSTGGFATIDAAVDTYINQTVARQGAVATIQAIAKNGFGVTLTAAQVELHITELAAAGINSGSKLINYLSTLQGTNGATLDNRAQAASSFLETLSAAGKSAHFMGIGVNSAVSTLLQNIGSSSASLANATSGFNALSANLTASGITGTVDDYLSGATVFADTNRDGLLSTGEWNTTTSANGTFEVPNTAGSGKIIAYGGTDLMTGNAFKGLLSSTTGGTTINPITTMIEAMVTTGQADTVQNATNALKGALDLSADINLQSYNALAVLASTTSSSAQKATALKVQIAAQQISNIITQIASVIDIGTTGATLQSAAAAVSIAIAQAITTAAASSGGTIDLANPATLVSIIQTAFTATGTVFTPTQVAQVAQITAGSNTAASVAINITMLAQAADVAQGGATNALIAGSSSGDFSSAVSDFTGVALNTANYIVTVGSIAPGVPTPPTVSQIAVTTAAAAAAAAAAALAAQAPTASLAYSTNGGVTSAVTATVNDANTLRIIATFNKAVSDGTPAISINNGILASTAMTKIDSTHYFFDLNVPVGDIATATVTISGARDVSSNPILVAPINAVFAIDNTAPTAPTAVSLTTFGGTVLANALNASNTNMTATAAITAGQATGGNAVLKAGATTIATDSTILAGDTAATFNLGSATTAALQAAVTAGGVVTVTLTDAVGNASVSAVANPTLAVDYTPPTAPTAVVLTAVGGTVVANSLNSTNTNMTATATIGAGEVTGGSAVLKIGATTFATDNTILAGDTAATFSLGVATNAALQAAIAAGGVATVTVTDAVGNSAVSAVANPTLAVDYTAPTAPTAVVLTSVGGTVVANVLNATNTNMTATATITAGQATGGSAVLKVGATTIATDNTILVGDTQATFNLGVATTAALQAAVAAGGVATVTVNDAVGNASVSAVANPTLVVDYTPPTAPTAVVLTAVGGTVVANSLNTTNTNMTATATISAGEATGGSAVLKIGATTIATDDTILAGDTAATFSLGVATNAALQAAIAAGGVATVTVTDAVGNSAVSAVANPTLVVDYTILTAPTAVVLTSAGGTVVANALNATNTNMTATATITAGQATGGSAVLKVGATTIATDNTILAGDTAATFNLGVATTAALQAAVAAGGVATVTVTNSVGNSAVSAVANPTLVVDYTPPTAPTAVVLTAVGGTVVANTLNTTNTNMTATATISAGEATGGSAVLKIGATTIATDNTILAGDTAATFSLGVATNAALKAAVAAGGVATVTVTDAVGNSTVSTVANPTLAVDYTAPAAPTVLTLTTIGGTVVPNELNSTNTNLTAVATITAGQATGGSAVLKVGATTIATDATILVGDTSVTFDIGSTTNAALKAAVAAGGVATVTITDTAGNATVSAISNPTLAVDYLGALIDLTTANDSLDGSTGNDTFTGTYGNGAGPYTFNTGDILNGLAGTADKLNVTTGAEASTPPDNLWIGKTNFEKVVFNSTGNGAQVITTGANFEAAFAANGVNLTAKTLLGAIDVTMTSFTGAATITTTTTGAGAHTITTGSGVTTVNATGVAAGAQTINGVGLTTVDATVNGAGDQVIGTTLGGNLVTVNATVLAAGSQTIASTSSSNVTIVADAASGAQVITTAGGNDKVTTTGAAGQTATISTGSGNDVISAGLSTDLITGGTGADTMTGGGAVDRFEMNADGSVIGTAMDIITDFNTAGADVLSFGAGTTVLLTVDATALVAGVNVNTSAGGLISFHASDNTLAAKTAAVQADVQLDAAGSVAMFVDSGNTYVYYAGAAAGNVDDQLIQLTGITSLTAMIGGATLVIS
ncbi:MAG: calcium-binding protein [Gammaproteobacteria bacterium]|nr:calcium-binding protein [Gammaproteobacteria bacterium]